MQPTLAALATIAIVFAPVFAVSGPDSWPGFRGAKMDGLSGDAALATTWSKTDHVAWVADAVPGIEPAKAARAAPAYRTEAPGAAHANLAWTTSV